MEACAELARTHVGEAARSGGEQEGVEEGREITGLLGLGRRRQRYIS